MSSDSRRTRRCSEREPAVQLTLKYDRQWRLAPVADLSARLQQHTRFMTPVFATTLSFSDFAIIAWLVIVFGGAAAYTTRRAVDLRRIERKLDALIKHHGISVPPQESMSEEVQRLARDPAQKIAAIKLHREQTGLGLAKAKADIEDFIKSAH